MAPTLLVLAAGMGSRYGGLKQIDPVGPSGEALLDYAVFDAIRAGFGRVVFVIRREFEDAFRSSVASKFSGRIAFECVFQSTDDLPGGCAVPAGRERPWGTGHAVWCARAALDGPFAAINADDFYGAGSFSRLRGFLEGARGPRFALVGFRLADTLSEGGTVVTAPPAEWTTASAGKGTACSCRSPRSGRSAAPTWVPGGASRARRSSR